jgi:hypothetical protein
MKKNKRGQAWSIDLIIAVIIFSAGILIFFIYSINQAGEAKKVLNELGYQGDVILNNILSEGYPVDWNNTNVVTIGIMTNNKINETKLERFYNYSTSDYQKTRSKFNTRYDYYFTFSNMTTLNSSYIDGIGRVGTNVSNISSSSLIKITRFSIYKEKPTTVYLYIWEK